ncbi:M24 family metallopeptidase [Actinomycetota bacterium]|nr:M24 family metallopeptidase [Actinomycetota bacterium]
MQFTFSNAEIARRRSSTLRLAVDHDCYFVLAFGENRSGAAVTYLTQWPVTRLAACRLNAYSSELWVAFHNHTPYAKRVAYVDAVHDFTDNFPTELFAGVNSGTCVGTLGVVPVGIVKIAASQNITLVSLDKAHAELRMIKSAEEIEALRLGAAASDIGAQALINACRVGASDWELLAAAKNAYTQAGGRDHICYLAVTDMHAPDRDVPSQFPEGRIVTNTSVITFELSAAVAHEYPGQILRSIVMGEPTETYVELSRVAEECKAHIKSGIRAGVNTIELIQSSHMIETAGFSTTDDLFHGFGMGYLEPIATSVSRVPNHSPKITLEQGMAIVVQPNVTLADHSAGVQTGELIVVSESGVIELHNIPTGLIVIP